MSRHSDWVQLFEVGPRDGLQGEKTLPPEVRLQLIEKLLLAGCHAIEIGSFVSPKRLPQMADTEQLARMLPKQTTARFTALAANSRGVDQALDCGIDQLALFTATSDQFTEKNIGLTVQESLQRFRELAQYAMSEDLPVRGYLSTIIACPYAGPTEPEQVARIAVELYRIGCRQISLGDTIGVGTPKQVRAVLQAVLYELPAEAVAVHFHDTYGQALANVCTALEMGIRTVDASIAGLGGCPYAPGAAGNLASEDLVYLLNGLGMDCGISLPKLVDASAYICDQLKKPAVSKVAQAMLAKRRAATKSATALNSAKPTREQS
jgi:hydroxymethylglutaryl-CoA lyase